ncbi:GldG family protein [Desulfococcaceae bacterium HSG9]|nr:GldG family protein [Desulfococcaceae bacterium HSG9]
MKSIFGKYLKLFIYLVVVVLINLVGATLFFRLDLTENNLYTLSEGSQKVVATLSEPLTINVFFTKDLPAPHNNTERYLHDLLEEYHRNGNRFFNYQFFDVDPESEGVSSKTQENREIANNYGISPIQIQLIEKDQVKFTKAYMGLVIIHGDQIERIPTITSTEGLEYKLTTAIQKLNNKVSALLNLTDKIDITLYMSSALKQVAPYMGLKELPQYPQEVEKIVEKLNSKTYGKLAYKYIDPTAAQIPAADLAKYHLTALKWPAIKKANIPPGNGVIGMVMSYSGKMSEIPLLKVMRIPIIGTQYDLTEISHLEELISDNLESLVDINEKLGFLADHGALNISAFAAPMGMRQPQGATELGKLLSQNYSLTPVNIKEDGIPEGLKSLIIARPTEKFSDYELWQIDQALMRGTDLMILPDPFNEVMPPRQQQFGMQGPMFVPADTGLNKLMAHWGVNVNQALVMDKNCYKQRLQQQFGGGESPLYFAPIIKNQNINRDLPFMNNIKGMVALKIAPLALDQKQIEANKITAHRLFASSAESWEMRGRINLNPMFIRPPTDEKEFASVPLAYLLEGEFTSYFKGKPMPEKPAEKKEEGASENKADAIKPEDEAKADKDKKPEADLSEIESQGSFIAKSPPGKIFIMASSEMLKDNVIDPAGQSPNSMFILNVVDALNNRADIAAMRSKVQRFNPLDETDPALKTFTKAFNIAGLPILVILFGLFVWIRRHSRKKQLQMLFP